MGSQISNSIHVLVHVLSRGDMERCPRGLRCASPLVPTLSKTKRSHGYHPHRTPDPELGAADAAGKQTHVASALTGNACYKGKVIHYLRHTQVNTKLQSMIGIKEKQQRLQERRTRK